MALVPIISQTWDTTSVFTPTRMNNIEQNLAIVSNATGVKYSNGVSVKDAIDTKATQNKYTGLNITNSVGGVESNKAVLRVSGDIGLCDFTYKCQNASNETLSVSLPTGWSFEYTGITIRDTSNGNLATCWANNNQMSTYLHTGTMVVGHDYKVCIPCYK